MKKSDLIRVKRCPLCQARRKSKVFDIVNNNYRQVEQVTAVKCKSCGLVYFDPDVSDKAKVEYHSELYFVAPSEDKVSGYPNYIDPAHLECKKYFGRIIKSWIRRIHPKAKSILDVGCAVGAMSVPFAEAGWKVTGIDLGQWAVDWGKENYGLDLRQGSLMDMKEDVRYDMVLFWDAFEHFKNPKETLEKVKRLTNPGAVMVFQVPDVSKFIDDPSHYLWSTYQHSCFYTRETFTKLIICEDLKLEKKFPSTQESEMVFIVRKK